MTSQLPARPPIGPRFVLLVPTTATSIAAGSAIVAEEAAIAASGERVLVHYEGNLYGSEEMNHYPVRALHAAGRAQQRYPTTAKAYVERGSVLAVGTYDTRIGRITAITDPDALTVWLGSESLPRICDPTAASLLAVEVARAYRVPGLGEHPTLRAASRWTGNIETRDRSVAIEAITQDGGVEWLEALPSLGQTMRWLVRDVLRLLRERQSVAGAS